MRQMEIFFWSLVRTGCFFLERKEYEPMWRQEFFFTARRDDDFIMIAYVEAVVLFH